MATDAEPCDSGEGFPGARMDLALPAVEDDVELAAVGLIGDAGPFDFTEVPDDEWDAEGRAPAPVDAVAVGEVPPLLVDETRWRCGG